MTFVVRVPEILVLLIFAANLIFAIHKHKKYIVIQHNFWITLGVVFVEFWVLWFGGFFN